MPCKRPRQFNRTASMSQLGHGGSANYPARSSVNSNNKNNGKQQQSTFNSASAQSTYNSVQQQINIIRKAVVENHSSSSTHEHRGILHVSPSPAPSPSPHFLDVCFLCMRSLGQGRDIFMYRGDRAFCSAECRHNQILADERAEKSRVANMIKQAAISSAKTAAANISSATTNAAANVQRISNSTNSHAETATAA